MLDSLAMRAIVEDVSQGFRLLWHVPGFAIPIVLLLCLGITAAGVPFSVLDALLLRDTTAVPTALRIEADWRVLAFGIAISLLTALLVGLAPAFQAPRTDIRTGQATSFTMPATRKRALLPALHVLRLDPAAALRTDG